MGRVLVGLTLTAAVLAGVGDSGGWLDFARTSHASEPTYTVKGNKNAVRADAEAAAREAREVGTALRDRAAQTAGPKLIRGAVAAVDPVGNTLTVQAEGEGAKVTFATDKGTRVLKNGQEISLAQLQPGERVAVEFTLKDGQRRAQSVTVETK